MTDDDEAWKVIGRMTLDELVTRTKLAGSSVGVNGHTIPEGWPFAIVVAVAKPGNEAAVEWAQEFHAKMEAAATGTVRTDRTKWP